MLAVVVSPGRMKFVRARVSRCREWRRGAARRRLHQVAEPPVGEDRNFPDDPVCRRYPAPPRGFAVTQVSSSNRHISFAPRNEPSSSQRWCHSTGSAPGNPRSPCPMGSSGRCSTHDNQNPCRNGPAACAWRKFATHRFVVDIARDENSMRNGRPSAAHNARS